MSFYDCYILDLCAYVWNLSALCCSIAHTAFQEIVTGSHETQDGIYATIEFSVSLSTQHL